MPSFGFTERNYDRRYNHPDGRAVLFFKFHYYRKSMAKNCLVNTGWVWRQDGPMVERLSREDKIP